MKKCDVCGSTDHPSFVGAWLCKLHHQIFTHWLSRWRASTGFAGEIDISREAIVNLLRNQETLHKAFERR